MYDDYLCQYNTGGNIDLGGTKLCRLTIMIHVMTISTYR